MYTMGSYGQVSTRNPDELKTTDSNMDDLSTTKQESIKTTDDDLDLLCKVKESIRMIDSAVEYSYNCERRLRRFEEKLKNVRTELETIRDESVKISGEETLDRFEEQLAVARNYLILVKEGESADRLDAYLIDMERRLEEIRRRYVYIKHMEEIGYRTHRALRRSSDCDERGERLRRFFVRPKSELHEDSLIPHVALGRRFWNMINP